MLSIVKYILLFVLFFCSYVHTTKCVLGSVLDLIGGGSQQSASRSGTPAVGTHRKSPTADQGTQVCP